MYPTTAKDDAISNVKTADHNVADNLHNAAHRAGQKVRSMYNSASEEISHASDTVTTEIRTNPVRSSVIALGIGVLLGALIRR